MLLLKKNEALISMLPAPRGWLVVWEDADGDSVYEEVAAFARIRVLVDGEKLGKVAFREQMNRIVALVSGDGPELWLAPPSSKILSPLFQMQMGEQAEQEEGDEPVTDEEAEHLSRCNSCHDTSRPLKVDSLGNAFCETCWGELWSEEGNA